MIIGFCGREGAGKSSAAEYIIKSSTINVEYELYSDIWKYIEDCTGIKNIPKDRIMDIIPNIKLSGLGPKIIESSEIIIAQPLKQICSAITGVPYHIMCGVTIQDRIEREKKIPGIGLSSREVLQKIGTIFRENNENIWIDIAIKRALENTKTQKFSIISDVRYGNEINIVKKNGGIVIYICRHISDLVITDTDRLSHPSCWEFLNYYNNDPVVVNDTNIENMANQILQYINF